MKCSFCDCHQLINTRLAEKGSRVYLLTKSTLLWSNCNSYNRVFKAEFWLSELLIILILLQERVEIEKRYLVAAPVWVATGNLPHPRIHQSQILSRTDCQVLSGWDRSHFNFFLQLEERECILNTTDRMWSLVIKKNIFFHICGAR